MAVKASGMFVGSGGAGCYDSLDLRDRSSDVTP
jgi:hypothetical protein